MLIYFLIISIVIFIFIHSFFYFNRNTYKSTNYNEVLALADLYYKVLYLYLLFFISLLLVILFDITYKFGIIGFIIGLLLIFGLYKFLDVADKGHMKRFGIYSYYIIQAHYNLILWYSK